MGGEIDVPYLHYEDLRAKADDFLAEFHPSSEVPIPIEEIVEFQLGMNIFPLPGIKDLLDIDGFISSDLTVITVDEYIYNRFENRYRFTLAHEVGHVWMHKDVFEKADINNIEGWKEFVTEIPEKQHNALEYQANCFAGLILVPHGSLMEVVNSKVKLLDENDISLKENWGIAWEYICTDVARTFSVSKEVVERRVDFDRVKERYGGK